MKLEKLYKKIGKKFSRIYNLSFHFNGNITGFTFDPYYGLEDKTGKKIIVKLKIKKECYHQWRYFNRWCQECGEFTDNDFHGTVVSHCFKCGVMWDKEFGFWSQEAINNIFFNEHFQTNK